MKKIKRLNEQSNKKGAKDQRTKGSKDLKTTWWSKGPKYLEGARGLKGSKGLKGEKYIGVGKGSANRRI